MHTADERQRGMWPGASRGLGLETQGVPSSPLFLCFNFPQRYLEILHGDVSQLVKNMAQRRKRNKNQNHKASFKFLLNLKSPAFKIFPALQSPETWAPLNKAAIGDK